MTRPPRDPQAPLFGVEQTGDEAKARGMAFITLVLGNLGLVLTNRALQSGVLTALRRPNPALLVVCVLTGLALLVALALPWLRGRLRSPDLQ